jgi:hypothetical protein
LARSKALEVVRVNTIRNADVYATVLGRRGIIQSLHISNQKTAQVKGTRKMTQDLAANPVGEIQVTSFQVRCRQPCKQFHSVKDLPPNT